MKTIQHLLIIASVLGGISRGIAQDEQAQEFRYLLGDKDGKVHVSGFGAYNLGFSSFDGNLAVYNGAGGAVLLNQTVYFGAYGTGLSTQHRIDEFQMKDYMGNTVAFYDLYTTFGHGGFWIGYQHESYKPIHFGVSSKFGWGAVGLVNRDYSNYDDVYDYYSVADDHVFVINPQIEVEANLLKWFKINLAAGYQFVTGINQTYTNLDGQVVEYFDSSDFNQPMLNLSFIFGGFGGKR